MKNAMGILKAVAGILLVLSLSTSVHAIIVKPTDEQQKIFAKIIEPRVSEIWENRKQLDYDLYIIQNIQKIDLVRVDTLENREVYVVKVIFYAEYFMDNKKVDAAQMSQKLLFLVKENEASGWDSLPATRLKTFPVNTSKRLEV